MENLLTSFPFSFVFLVVLTYTIFSMFSMKDMKRMDEEHFKLPVKQKEGL
ncbi:hypothetical protein [Bacillus toyonensis]|nr:hypothetical protein [Bacillus toyonensis]